MFCVYAILAISLNEQAGYLGEVSLGHSIFFAVGAYASAILVVNYNVPYWLSVVLATLIAGLFGALLGIQTLRVSGTYLAIISLGFFYIIRMIILIWDPVTNGAIGIFNIPPATIFGIKLKISNCGAYYHILAFLIIAIIVDQLFIKSKAGRAIMAIREDRLAADLVGIKTGFYKVLTFFVSCAMAGFAGTFYGQFISYINTANFTYDMSIMVLAMVILGGRGSIKGAVLGAAILSPLGEVIRSLTGLMSGLPSWMQLKNPDQWRFAIFGLILILVMQFKPLGILGELDKNPYKMPKGVTVENEGGNE